MWADEPKVVRFLFVKIETDSLTVEGADDCLARHPTTPSSSLEEFKFFIL